MGHLNNLDAAIIIISLVLVVMLGLYVSRRHDNTRVATSWPAAKCPGG